MKTLHNVGTRLCARTAAHHVRHNHIVIEHGVDTLRFLESRGKWDQRVGQVALKDGATGAQVTYDRLKPSYAAAGNALEKQRVKRLMLALPNCVNFPIALFGAFAKGVTAVTCSPAFTATEFATQLKSSRADQVLTIPELRPVLEEAADMAGFPKDQIIALGEAGSEHFAVNEAGGEVDPTVDFTYTPTCPRSEPACILYSSGTTGLPKGVMLTHDNFVANTSQITDAEDMFFNLGQHNYDMTPGSGKQFSLLCTLPYFHVYPLVIAVMAPLMQGGRVVSMPKFDPVQFLTLLQDEKIDVAPVVPPIMIFLSKHPMVDQFDLSNLKTMYSAAAPCDTALQEAVTERLNITVAQGYGMTELTPVATVSPMQKILESKGADRSDIRPGSIGKAIANTELRIVAEDGSFVMEPDTTGELYVRGPQVMLGYLDNQEATTTTITRDGWLKTGDIVKRCEDGFYYVVDRKKELIKVKGNQVAPAELEGHLLLHPAVADVAVIPMPDERAGERPRACVVLKPDAEATEDELKEHVAKALSAYKHLGAVTFVDEVPKSASGKILREAPSAPLECPARVKDANGSLVS
eukprot:TRINITY_DN7388_c0_g1_i3.p1 TRINITY_DN7388_c0_g1~~TRINITY_DN7388_c0_g1_i3.p1  ORF type:complete len:579 (+),score=183.59 TRINITY_DN7388_c0_g1_i3:40-1776(+)